MFYNVLSLLISSFVTLRLENETVVLNFGSKNLYKPAVLYLAHVPELKDLVNTPTHFDLYCAKVVSKCSLTSCCAMVEVLSMGHCGVAQCLQAVVPSFPYRIPIACCYSGFAVICAKWSISMVKCPFQELFILFPYSSTKLLFWYWSSNSWQGSKLRLIRLPMWPTLSPWRLKILV